MASSRRADESVSKIDQRRYAWAICAIKPAPIAAIALSVYQWLAMSGLKANDRTLLAFYGMQNAVYYS
jgi:hypothetical protein